jgi:hypothetical protein
VLLGRGDPIGVGYARFGVVGMRSSDALMSALSLYAPKPVISRLLRASQRNDLSG